MNLRFALDCLINAERVKHGLPALKLNVPLIKAARTHANAAVSWKWWGPGKDSHTNPITRSKPAGRMKYAGYCPGQSFSSAEITYTGWGGGGTPRAAFTWWMNSPTHRAIILDPGLTEIGRVALPGAADESGAGAAGAGTYVADLGHCGP
ncbi:CAP domain-containing protein [Streptomyces sp. NPDC005574]|uniref:CAP domain-containing protein n=1 Tax=Streptomyces sp. NPDC005574 TaxID=3156891 RepID=UPI00339DF313